MKQRILLLTANPIQNTYKELEALYSLIHTDTTTAPIPLPMIRRKPDTSYLPVREDIVRSIPMSGSEIEEHKQLEQDSKELLPIVSMIRQ